MRWLLCPAWVPGDHFLVTRLGPKASLEKRQCTFRLVAMPDSIWAIRGHIQKTVKMRGISLLFVIKKNTIRTSRRVLREFGGVTASTVYNALKERRKYYLFYDL